MGNAVCRIDIFMDHVNLANSQAHFVQFINRDRHDPCLMSWLPMAYVSAEHTYVVGGHRSRPEGK